MANKRLGQHFLQNGGKLQKIADALAARKGSVVVEIGPGRGELTEKLVAAGARVLVIEKDADLIPLLLKRCGGNVEVLQGDVRDVLPAVAADLRRKKLPYLLVGNIPYYLTGFLFRIIGELEHKPVRVVFTIQKEVAERIAHADRVGMNLLAASIAWWADVTYVTAIPRAMFSPPPKVDSAVVSLEVKRGAGGMEAYMRVMKHLFSHPRKMALSNLAEAYGKKAAGDAFSSLGIDTRARPGALTARQLLLLSSLLESLAHS